jgi:hypothetical protein
MYNGGMLSESVRLTSSYPISGKLLNFFLFFSLKGISMKSLMVMKYKQPVHGKKLRIGVVHKERDTFREPVAHSYYRKHDREFRRSRRLTTMKCRNGFHAFYKERTNWVIEIPYVGSLLSWAF